MPVFEMPLSELREYRGVNPRPADFDDYWKQATEEMRRVDSDVEIKESGFQAPYCRCFDLFYTGVRGARIHALYLQPTNAPTPHPAVLHFHGYTGNAGDWSEHLHYAAAGFSVLAMDCRGQGGRSRDPGGVVGNTLHGHIIRGLDGNPHDLLFRHIFLDTAQLAAIAMEMDEIDPDRIGAAGGSQGGALTVACAALEPRIRRAAPRFPFLSDYRRVWDMDLAKGAYQELTDYFRRFDPLHVREDDIFTRLGYIDIQHLAPRIQGEVMWTVGLMDTICPPSTQFAAYNKIGATKSMRMYPDFGHEQLPGIADETFQFMLRMLNGD